jgi:hypothetical protein
VEGSDSSALLVIKQEMGAIINMLTSPDIVHVQANFTIQEPVT